MSNDIPHVADLHWRRREVVVAIDSGGYTPEKDQFTRLDIDHILGNDNTTTTGLLNNLAREDQYLRRVRVGGSPLLRAEKPDDDDETAITIPQQERLARKMVDEEGLDLTPERYQWGLSSQRQAFQNAFNTRSTKVTLDAWWTSNKYVVTTVGAKRMREWNESS
jgi:hypothetical protein